MKRRDLLTLQKHQTWQTTRLSTLALPCWVPSCFPLAASLLFPAGLPVLMITFEIMYRYLLRHTKYGCSGYLALWRTKYDLLESVNMYRYFSTKIFCQRQENSWTSGKMCVRYGTSRKAYGTGTYSELGENLLNSKTLVYSSQAARTQSCKIGAYVFPWPQQPPVKPQPPGP